MILFASRDTAIYVEPLPLCKDSERAYLVSESVCVTYLGWAENSIRTQGFHLFLLPSGKIGWLPGYWSPVKLIEYGYFHEL